MQLKVTVEILDNDGAVIAEGEIASEFLLQAGYPIAVKMGNIVDAVVSTIKDDTYE